MHYHRYRHLRTRFGRYTRVVSCLALLQPLRPPLFRSPGLLGVKPFFARVDVGELETMIDRRMLCFGCCTFCNRVGLGAALVVDP